MSRIPLELYADGATLDEIEAFDKNKVSGYTFNPTLFRMLGVNDYIGHCYKLVEACGNVPISFEVIADDIGGMIEQAKILRDIASNVYVKIPITFTSGTSTYDVIEALVKEGLNLNITAVFSREQVEAILPLIENTKTIVSVFAGRIFDIGVDAVRTTHRITDLVHSESECRVLWASPRMSYDIVNAYMANCDIITMKPDLIKKLSLFEKTLDEYSLDTVKMFYRDAVSSNYTITR